MINSYSLATSEIDDLTAAIEDINTQLSEITLLKHSAGIVTCHYDYAETGIISALREVLPFPFIGYTTFTQATPKVSGLFELSITVLTSDDVYFSVASGTVDGANNNESIKNTFDKAANGFRERPSFIISFLCANLPFSGDEYLRRLDVASGGVPVFGAIATGDNEVGDNVFVIFDGEIISKGFVDFLFFGPVEIDFHYGSYPEEKLIQRNATVTKSKGNTVYELNDLPATEFLLKLGFDLSEDARAGIITVPFMYHYPEDKTTLIARTMGTYTPEGRAEFFGEVPEGAVLYTGTVTIDDMLEIANLTTKKAVDAAPDSSLILVFSCVGRYVTLGLETTSETNCIAKAIPGEMNYLTCYAGGEICPAMIGGGQHNIFHNASVVTCTIS